MQFFGKSDIGKKRSENQDSFITEQLSENTVLCLVCDGMGGANGGSTASSLACKTFVENVKKKLQELQELQEPDQLQFEDRMSKIETIIKKAVNAANSAVFRKASRSKKLSGMGTTLVCALIIDRSLYVANIGDSRLYGFSGDNTVQITHDHSYVQTLVDLGQITQDEANNSPYKNIITKAIGIQKKEEPDIFFDNLSESNYDYLLLCSDGLTNYATAETIHQIVKSKCSLEEKCSKLIDTANENGGGDNITVVLIDMKD